VNQPRAVPIQENEPTVIARPGMTQILNVAATTHGAVQAAERAMLKAITAYFLALSEVPDGQGR